MTSLAAPAAPAQDLLASVRAKLDGAPAPLKLADVAKGLPRPRKVKAPDFQQAIRTLLDEQVRLGQAFSYPSGKGGIDRYWSKDEKHLLATRALELAATPMPLPKLKTTLGKQAAGTDPGFLDTLLRELIGQNRLHEHPAKTKKSGPSYGANPPPPPLPPLAHAKYQKAVDKLAKDCRKLLTASGASEADLFETLRMLLVARPTEPLPPTIPAEGASTREREPVQETLFSALDELVLKAVATSPVLSLADLRHEMPAEYRGAAFDEAVLRLADARRVIIYQDADPSRFSDAERAEYVRDGGGVFTTIAKGNGP